MIDTLTIVLQTAGVWFTATILSSLLSSILYPLFRSIVARCRSSTRSLVTLGFAMITPAVSLATALIYLFPDFAQSLVLPHCHGAECGTHLPLVSAYTVGSVSLLAVASLLSLGLVVGLTRLLLRGRRRLATLFLLSEHGGGVPDHLVVDSDRLFAWCCGLFRKRLVLSSALVDQLDPVQLEAVLAHEQAHADRFDNLRNLTARLASAFWLPSRRQRLIVDLAEDAEACCDVAANARLAATDPADVEAVGRPIAAYVLLTVAWSCQMIAVAAVSHPVVEIVAAFGG